MFVNHCHAFPKGAFKKEEPEAGTIETLLSWMDELSIDKAVTFTPFPEQVKTTAREANQWLYEEIKGEERLVGFVTVNPLDADAIEILDQFAEKGLKGVKIHPPVLRMRINDERAEPFYARAEELGLPLLFHTGVHGWRLTHYMPILLDEVAQNHPNLKIIVEHMGGMEFFSQALAVVRNNKNCYAGITAIPVEESDLWGFPKDLLAYLFYRVDSKKIIYGTDYPWESFSNIKRSIEAVRSFSLPKEDEENILGRSLEVILPS